SIHRRRVVSHFGMPRELRRYWTAASPRPRRLAIMASASVPSSASSVFVHGLDFGAQHGIRNFPRRLLIPSVLRPSRRAISLSGAVPSSLSAASFQRLYFGFK